MKEKIRIICGNTFEDYDISLKIISQYRLQEIPIDSVIGLPVSNDIRYYVKIESNFKVSRYIYEGGRLFLLTSEL